jgi:hypothetical protein
MVEKTTDAGPAPNPLVAATDRLRESATWLLGAFAAVGAVAGGLQLANIGKLGTDVPGRLGAAIVGRILTVAAIVVAVSAAARASARSRVNLAMIGTPDFASARSQVDGDQEALAGFGTVANLAVELLARRTAVLQKMPRTVRRSSTVADPLTREDHEQLT